MLKHQQKNQSQNSTPLILVWLSEVHVLLTPPLNTIIQPFVFTIECRVGNKIWRHGPLSFKHVTLWWYFFYPRLTTHKSNIAVQCRKVTKYHPYTLVECGKQLQQFHVCNCPIWNWCASHHGTCHGCTFINRWIWASPWNPKCHLWFCQCIFHSNSEVFDNQSAYFISISTTPGCLNPRWLNNYSDLPLKYTPV